MKVITRERAIEFGLKRYFTGEPCKHGHICERQVGDHYCLYCRRLQSRKHHNANKEKNNAKHREWMIANREQVRLKEAEYWAKNKDKKAAKGKRYYEKHKDRLLAESAIWRKANPGKCRAQSKLGKARRANRVPPWLTKEHKRQIRRFYNMAQELTEKTGIVHSVDHIHPLNGKLLSGLHVPWNLQVMTLADNVAKGNKWPYQSSDSYHLGL